MFTNSTGWPKSKVAISNSYSSVIFDLIWIILRAKWVWRVAVFCVKSYFLKKMGKSKIFEQKFSFCVKDRIWTSSLLFYNPELYPLDHGNLIDLDSVFWWFYWECRQDYSVCHKKPPLFKHILVFTTWGQKVIVFELQSFEIATFDLGHPVAWNVIF